jgi:bifunctional non-homologous end joining protein LigD
MLRSVTLPHMHPMRLARRLEPFGHPDWIYEIKFDGFRALSYVQDGKCSLVYRRRHKYKSFRQLRASIATSPQWSIDRDAEITTDRRHRRQ